MAVRYNSETALVIFSRNMRHFFSSAYRDASVSTHEKTKKKKPSLFYRLTWPVKRKADFHSLSLVEWTTGEGIFYLGCFPIFSCR